MLERDFQKKLVKDLKSKFTGCYVHKNDGSNVEQGFPDLVIYHKGKTAFLECKASKKAKKEANQDLYVDRLNRDGFFASFIFPENKAEVINELEAFMN